MNDEELNKEIIKLHGWELLPPPATPRFQKPSLNSPERYLYREPQYVTNMADAWMLVEEMAQRMDCFELKRNSYGEWTFDAASPDEPNFSGYYPSGCANTAPLAIAWCYYFWMSDEMSKL